jgi:hypothetical protein
MTQRINKFLLDRVEGGRLALHAGFKVLTVQPQGRHIAIWVADDEHQEVNASVDFQVYKTGDVYPDHLKYAGSVQFDSGHYAAHVFY